MELQKQLCSFMLGFHLKALDVPQESQMYHYQEKSPTNKNLPGYGYTQAQMPWHIQFGCRPEELSTLRDRVAKWCSAFSVAELGEVLQGRKMFASLPKYLRANTHIGRTTGRHSYWYFFTKEPFIWGEETTAQTEADARALMLIYLIENDLINL